MSVNLDVEPGRYAEEQSPNLSGVKWSKDVDSVLDNIRCNCVILSDYHKTKYFFLQARLKYFRIPVIILSAFSSVFNIGLQPFLAQSYISIVCCMMSLITGLIGSIELFLQIQKRMESDLLYSRDFYLLAIDIFKMLSLEVDNRNGDGLTFLEEKFNIYRKLVENSNIIGNKIVDKLAPIGRDAVKQNSNTDRVDTKSNDIESSPCPCWSLNKEVEEVESVNTEDRFQIYCELIKKESELDPDVLERVSNIIMNDRNQYTLPIQERMKMLLLLSDKLDDSKMVSKLKPILVSDFFTKEKDSSVRLMNQIICRDV